MYWKSSLATLAGEIEEQFFSCELVTMQGLFVLRFYHPDKTHKIDRLIHTSVSKMALKMSSVVQQLMYVLKLFRVTAGGIHSFRICSKETLRIRFWIWIKNPFLDSSKETKYQFSD